MASPVRGVSSLRPVAGPAPSWPRAPLARLRARPAPRGPAHLRGPAPARRVRGPRARQGPPRLGEGPPPRGDGPRLGRGAPPGSAPPTRATTRSRSSWRCSPCCARSS
ncbi:hypothetical protein SSBG_06378 [Streptomyces sp. SPB074]|nr:hypothetical protein SSBG_06378 [Streptomyces sp. SPB074]